MAEIISTGLETLIYIDWATRQAKFHFQPRVALKAENTYMVIFSKTQEEFYKCFLTIPGLKILFQSQPAVNTVHPTQPRNFVVVFEVENDIAAYDATSMPSM